MFQGGVRCSAGELFLSECELVHTPRPISNTILPARTTKAKPESRETMRFHRLWRHDALKVESGILGDNVSFPSHERGTHGIVAHSLAPISLRSALSAGAHNLRPLVNQPHAGSYLDCSIVGA